MQPERQPDGTSRWLCQGDSAVITACAHRRFGPAGDDAHHYSTLGIGGHEAQQRSRR